MRAMLALLVAAGVLLALFAPAAAADPVGVLVDRLEEKTDEAQEDPVGFVGNHTSEEGLEREAKWTRDYACFGVREVAKEATDEPPDVPFCPEFEVAREEDRDEEDADEALAEELGFDAVGEAQALVADALGTVDRIVDDPGSALDELLGFIDRCVQVIKRIVDGVLGFVRDLVGGGFSLMMSGLGGLWDALVWTATLPQLTGEWMMDTAGAAISQAGSGVSSAWDAATGLVGSSVDAVGGAMETITETIRETARSIFGTQTASEDPTRTVNDAERRVDDTTSGLLDSVEDRLPSL